MAAVLVVCTGNVCRSPVAEGLVRAAMQARFGASAPTVASAGVAGWQGSGADAHSVTALAERGIDISRHRGRRVAARDVADATLILAMAYEHREALARIVPEAADRTFTLKELVRLLEALPSAPVDGDPGAMLGRRVADAAALRRSGFEGNPHDDDVADPLGLPIDAFRAMTWEIGEWVDRLDAALFGRAPARASAEGQG
ncbi:MAG TPA: low molecular weight phosphatase family protein [Actinomycetota bacterium]|nr:low molecular weight phosphatase family protein [Actinomycetota bacterium]